MFKLAPLLLAVLFIASCGDDDEDMMVCTQADWVGAYSGTQTCVGDDPQDVTITFIASGTDSLDIMYESADGTTVSFTAAFPFEGCSISANSTDLTVEATLTGDELFFRDVINAFDTDCSINATRN